MYSLESKVALVTGAGGKMGMGHAIALCLAEYGADVAVSDISLFGSHHTGSAGTEGWHGIKDVEAEIRSLGRKALAVEADISSSQQVQKMVARCIAVFGKIDILVNNAATTGPTGVPPFEISDEDWQRVLAVNLYGTYWCCKAVGTKMIERGQGGKIINIASEGAKGRIAPGWGPYLVSKYGVLGLTQVLALELAPYKINVNAVCPGVTATEMTEMSPMGDRIKSEVSTGISLKEAIAKVYAELTPQIPLGRVGQPEDVAKVVAFLASSDSDYMTGQAINVTGGHNMT